MKNNNNNNNTDQCNVPEHPDYPNYRFNTGDPPGSELQPPCCTVPGHPMLLCNVPAHPVRNIIY
jgi:hypothetical protein